jgi:hypothetical protein
VTQRQLQRDSPALRVAHNVGPLDDGGEAVLELIETMTHECDLRFEADGPFGAPLDAGRAGCPLEPGVEGNEPLRAVGAVDQAGRDLSGAVPRAQRRAGHPDLGLGASKWHPADVVELGEELELGLPLDQPTLPVGGH